MLDAALELAEANWPVHPLAGKTAATPHGFKDATTDPETIRGWWSRAPGRNIGIAVPPGWVVVDVDPRHGGDETLAGLPELPLTLTVRTGSGGRHLWFTTHAEGLTQSPLGPGLDTRVGGKGYVVAPPSVHPETGRAYEWVQPAAQAARLPTWIRTQLLPPPPPTKVYARASRKDGTAFLDWAYDRVRNASHGEGHNTLRATARLAGGHIAAGRLDEGEARRALLDAVRDWEHPDRTAEATIDWGIENGKLIPLRDR